MADPPQSIPPPDRTPEVESVCRGLAEGSDSDWNHALREALLAAIDRKRIWFDGACRIAGTAEKRGPRAALAELTVSLLYGC